MRITVFAVAMAILVTGLALLLVFGNGSAIAGLAPGDFANAIYLTIFALLVGAALLRGRHRVNARLWHVAVWLALFAIAMAGYRWFHSP